MREQVTDDGDPDGAVEINLDVVGKALRVLSGLGALCASVDRVLARSPCRLAAIERRLSWWAAVDSNHLPSR
jgi:hypothetical protein